MNGSLVRYVRCKLAGHNGTCAEWVITQSDDGKVTRRHLDVAVCIDCGRPLTKRERIRLVLEDRPYDFGGALDRE